MDLLIPSSTWDTRVSIAFFEHSHSCAKSYEGTINLYPAVLQSRVSVASHVLFYFIFI